MKTSVIGYPRIGEQRELKFALEHYWKKELSAGELEETGRQLRARHWKLQREAGIDYIPAMISPSMTAFWIRPVYWE